VTDAKVIRARTEAMRQLREDYFNEAVAAEKERLKIARPWWHAIFPFIITIRKRK
jgi:hypothetical protein